MNRINNQFPEGFTQSDVIIRSQYNNELYGWAWQKAHYLVQGEHSHKPVNVACHLELDFTTDIPDPGTGELLKAELVLPISTDEYQSFRHDKVELPEELCPNERPQQSSIEEDSSSALSPLESMFAPGRTTHDDSYEDYFAFEENERIKRVAAREYLERETLIRRYRLVSQIGASLLERTGTKVYLNSIGRPLTKGEPRPDTQSRGTVLRLKSPGITYKPFEQSGVSVGGATYDYHTSISDGKTYYAFEERAQETVTVVSLDEWRSVVRQDIARLGEAVMHLAQSVIDKATQSPATRLHGLNRDAASLRMSKRIDFFKGYQQYLPGGIHLLHCHVAETPAYDGSWEDAQFRIDVSEKKTDASEPSHVILTAGWDAAYAIVTTTKPYHSSNANTSFYKSSFDGIFSEPSMGGRYESKSDVPDYILKTLERSGLSDQDIQATLSGKIWGGHANPFSHAEYYKILQFLNDL